MPVSSVLCPEEISSIFNPNCSGNSRECFVYVAVSAPMKFRT